MQGKSLDIRQNYFMLILHLVYSYRPIAGSCSAGPTYCINYHMIYVQRIHLNYYALLLALKII